MKEKLAVVDMRTDLKEIMESTLNKLEAVQNGI